MYKCFHCGFEFPDPKKVYDHGTGGCDYECPNCESADIEEVAECAECGAMKCKDSLLNGLCEDCISIAAEDARTAFLYGADRTDCVELNGLLAWVLTRNQIEAIITNYLMNNGDLFADAKEYCLDDKDDFSEWLAERRKK